MAEILTHVSGFSAVMSLRSNLIYTVVSGPLTICPRYHASLPQSQLLHVQEVLTQFWSGLSGHTVDDEGVIL